MNMFNIRERMSEIVDLDFVLSIEEEENYFDYDTIALGIKGKNYFTVQERIEQFKSHCKQILDSFEIRVLQAQETASDLSDEVARNTPGSPPSESRVDYQDPASVRRYERKLAAYYKAKNLHEMLCSRAFHAQETFQSLNTQFIEKRIEVEAQIEKKKEELDPALEEDIVVFLENAYAFISSCVEAKKEILVGFTAAHISKKMYSRLEDKVFTVHKRRLANDILVRVDSEINRILENHGQALKEQFLDACRHVSQTFSQNADIFAEIKEYLAPLPYQECNENAEPANRFMSIIPDTEFEYRDVINPSELDQISQTILDRKVEYQNHINEIKKFSFTLEPLFTLLNECQGVCQQKIQAMRDVKQKAFGDTFPDYIFVLNLFSLKKISWFQDDQRRVVQMIREQVEAELSVELEGFISKTSGSNLLIGNAQNEVESNPCIRFLSFEQGLEEKISMLEEANKMLDDHLESVNLIPEETSRKARKEIWRLWSISYLPFLNLFFLAQIISTINRFSMAFKSTNPFYLSLKMSIRKILGVYSTIFSLIVLGAGIFYFLVNRNARELLLGVIAFYLIAALGFIFGFLKLKKLERN